MRIMMDVRVNHAGISTTPRYAIVRIGNSGSMQNFGEGNSNNSVSAAINANARFSNVLDVLSDTSAAHRGGFLSFSSFGSATSRYNPTVDFSLPWYADISMISVAENAITITGATWSGGFATYTTSAPHTLAVADKTVVSGITPSGWNTTAIVSAVGSSTRSPFRWLLILAPIRPAGKVAGSATWNRRATFSRWRLKPLKP
jgi:hypothetical protein